MLGIAVMTQGAIMASAIVNLCHSFATSNDGLRRMVQPDQEPAREINVIVA
jgi:hypothetical protein